MTVPTIPDGPRGSGSDILTDEKRHRLTRMADSLARDLMAQTDLSEDVRLACIERIERWRAESASLAPHSAQWHAEPMCPAHRASP